LEDLHRRSTLGKKLVLCAALVVALALTAAPPASADFAGWVTMVTNAANKIEASMPVATFINATDSVDNYKQPANAYYGKIALALRGLEGITLLGPPSYTQDDTIELAIRNAYSPAGTVHGAPRIFDLGLLSTSTSSASNTVAALQWADMELSAALGHTTAAGLDFQGYLSLSALGAFYTTLGGEGVINLAAWATYLPGIDAGFATSAAWVSQLSANLGGVSPSDVYRAGGIAAAIPAFMQHGGTVEAVSWTSALVALQNPDGSFGSGTVAQTAWNTGLAICALKRMGELVYSSQIYSALEWLRLNQIAAGVDSGLWGGGSPMEKLRIAAFVIDCAGKAIVETTPPAVALLVPAPGAVLCGSSSPLSASASDNLEVDRVVFSLDPTTLITVPGPGPSFDATFSTLGFAPGPHTLTATAYDDNGNSSSSSVSVIVDNTPPSAASITAPAAGALVGGTVAVKVSATDPVPGSGIQIVKVYDATDPARPYTSLAGTASVAPWQISWNTKALGTDGSHTLTAVAYDGCNATVASPAVEVKVDNTPPSCALFAPAAAACVSATVSLQADAIDANPGVTVAFYVDSTAAAVGVDATEAAPSPTHDYAWNSKSVADGSHWWAAQATDKVGNKSSFKYRIFTVDNTGPAVDLLTPLAGEILSGSSATWTATASDPDFGVLNVKFYVGGNLITTDPSAPYTGGFDLTALSDGTVALAAVATSAGCNGNSATDTNVVIVDRNPPQVSFSAPLPGAYVGGAAVTISANATDVGSGISDVKFYLDGTAPFQILGTDISKPYSMSWDTTGVANGAHTLIARATDFANFSAEATIGVTVENGTKPSCTWTAPTFPPATIVNGTAVTLSVNSIDNNGVAKVEFYLDATVSASKLGEDATASGIAYDIAWNTKTKPTTGLVGPYVLWARAIDKLGDYTDASIGVKVDNQAPGVSFVSPPTPADGATVSGTLTPLATAQVTITVDPTDYNLAGVASVSIGVFHISPGLPFQTEATHTLVAAPWTITWATDYTDNGVNRIAVTAVDNKGNAITTPLTRTVNVNNASFTDVPAYPGPAFAWKEIERVVKAGVTIGCATSPAGTQYCPTTAVTRGQMAAFLCRVKGWTWLDASPPTFADVPKTNTFFGYVERLVAQGVTAGCATSPRLYCVNDPVTRAEMAVFLCRTLNWTVYKPAVATFGDVPKDYWAWGYIERIYLGGVTAGCGAGPIYCPGSAVTRAQMAVFLCRAFPLATPGPP
jgi:hypothetical protein